MKLGTKGRYAVMAMVDLSLNENTLPVSIADVARRQGLSTSYLEQLFLKLRRCGLVISERGQYGGYKLARRAEAITIAEIILAADEEIKSTRCSLKTKRGCHGDLGHCKTHALWAGLENHIHHYLNSITLAEVCGSAHNDGESVFQEAS